MQRTISRFEALLLESRQLVVDPATPTYTDTTGYATIRLGHVQKLGRKELLALTYLANGGCQKHCERAIGISPTTFHGAIRGARRKLGARTTAEAVAIAVITGSFNVPLVESEATEPARATQPVPGKAVRR